MSKVTVAINYHGKVQQIPFNWCIVTSLDIKKQKSNFTRSPKKVDIELSASKLILTEILTDKGGYNLYHSHECPFLQLDVDSMPLKDNLPKFISVAVSMIVESSDHRILLTQRSSKLRTSPSTWVPPGGHLEPRETLMEAGFREVLEETGLSISTISRSTNILCLWENVYPLHLVFGEPKTHILTVYYHVRVSESSETLTKKMNINPEEVEAFTWLKPQVVDEMFNRKPDESSQEHIEQYQYVYENNELLKKPLPYYSMYNRWLWASGKFYSGAQCSLYQWYQVYKSNQCKY